jgi:hypothetical protein
MALRSTTYTNQAYEHFKISSEIDRHMAAMQAKLKPGVKNMRVSYYAQAKRFLENLGREMNDPVTPAGFVDPGAPSGIAAH